jgi:hypothetical protein
VNIKYKRMGKWPSQKKGKREGKERKGKSKGETSFPNPAKGSSVLPSLAEGRGGGHADTYRLD